MPDICAQKAAARCSAPGPPIRSATGITISRTETSSYLLQLGGLVLLGLGMGAAMTPATSAITEALPAAKQGIGSALNDLSREVGGALGIAVIGSILTAGSRSHLHLPGLPPTLV